VNSEKCPEAVIPVSSLKRCRRAANNDELGEYAALGLTLIDPLVLFHDDAWLITGQGRPSPAGLVVKNGLNIFPHLGRDARAVVRGCGFYPVPRLLVVALSAGSKVSSSASDLRLVAA